MQQWRPSPAPESTVGRCPWVPLGPSNLLHVVNSVLLVRTREISGATRASLPPGRLHFCLSVGCSPEAATLQMSVTLAPLGLELWKCNHVSEGPSSTEESGRMQREGREQAEPQGRPGLAFSWCSCHRGHFCMGPVCFELGEVIKIQRSGHSLPEGKPSCLPS